MAHLTKQTIWLNQKPNPWDPTAKLSSQYDRIELKQLSETNKDNINGWNRPMNTKELDHNPGDYDLRTDNGPPWRNKCHGLNNQVH